MLIFAEDTNTNMTSDIRLRQVEAGYEALVPQLGVSATGATVDEAVNNVIHAVTKALDAALLAKEVAKGQKHRKKTVA